jgi:hypothetical protein
MRHDLPRLRRSRDLESELAHARRIATPALLWVVATLVFALTAFFERVSTPSPVPDSVAQAPLPAGARDEAPLPGSEEHPWPAPERE